MKNTEESSARESLADAAAGIPALIERLRERYAARNVPRPDLRRREVERLERLQREAAALEGRDAP